MNFDLDTVDGMANAKKWLLDHLSRIADGGTWIVPRSATIINIDHERQVARIGVSLLPDPAIDRVFKAINWKVIRNE